MTFVVNRNINISNICTVGCAFCGFGQGKRSPDAYEHDRADLVRRIQRGDRLRCHRGVHPVGHPPRLDSSRTTSAGCGSRSRPPPRPAPTCTCTPTARWRSPTCATSRASSPSAVFGETARGRPWLDAGHGRRGPPRRGPRTDQPQQAPGLPLGRDHRSEPSRGSALNRDRHVRPHRGALGAGRAHWP